MFLYELAVEFDVRSTELIDIAADLGMGSLSASAVLSPDQVARLRAHVGAGGGRAPWADAARPSGPIEFAPPAEEPEPPASTAPPSLVLPPSPPRGVPAPEPLEFGPPVRFEPAVPSAAPASPTRPSSPSPRRRRPSETVDDDDEQQAPPAEPPRPMVGVGGATRNQRIALGSVIAAVVGLFGFMFVVGDRDSARERAIAAGEVGEPDRAKPAVATTTEPEATATEIDGGDPADLATFCAGGRALEPLLAQIAASLHDDAIDELRDLVATSRGAWDRSLDQIEQGGSPGATGAVQAFRGEMEAWFADVAVASSVADSYRSATEVGLARTLETGDELLAEFPSRCS
ncbi:MAG: hypothetical protein R2701_07120 [Acidimicrobiales bacterium]